MKLNLKHIPEEKLWEAKNTLGIIFYMFIGVGIIDLIMMMRFAFDDNPDNNYLIPPYGIAAFIIMCAVSILNKAWMEVVQELTRRFNPKQEMEKIVNEIAKSGRGKEDSEDG